MATSRHSPLAWALTVLDKLHSLLLVPAFAIRGVTVAVDVSRSGATDRPRLLEDSSAERDVVHAASVLFVPASDDNAGRQLVLVLVAQLLEQSRNRCYGRSLSVDLRVELRVVVDNVGDGLRVRSGSGAAAVNAVVDVRELVGDTVRLVIS